MTVQVDSNWRQKSCPWGPLLLLSSITHVMYIIKPSDAIIRFEWFNYPGGPSFDQVKRGPYIFIGFLQQNPPPVLLTPTSTFLQYTLSHCTAHAQPPGTLMLRPSASTLSTPLLHPMPPFGSLHTAVSCLPHIVRAWTALQAGSVHPSPFSPPSVIHQAWSNQW